MLSFLRNVLEYLSGHGIRGSLRYAWHRISEGWHERRLGIRTSSYVRARALGIENPFANDYAPMDYRGLYNVMRKLAIEPGKDVFLDYGSGMGRVVVVAATYPFAKVIGVELSPKLTQMAEENVSRAQKRLRCSKVELIAADASQWLLPPEVTVVFFFNPFVEELLSTVLGKIRRSVADFPRRLTLIYKPPAGQSETVLDKCGWLRRQWSIPCFGGRSVIGYRAHPGR